MNVEYSGLRDSLRMRGIPFEESTADRNEIRICCPFCTDRGESPDERFRLGLNLRTGQAHCFNCSWSSRKGPMIVMRRLKLEPAAFGFQPQVKEEEKKKLEVPKGLVRLDKHWRDSVWTRNALNYLEARGVGLDIIRKKAVLFSETGRFRYRIVFPVVVKGEIVGLVGRSIVKGHEPRYLNTPGLRAIWNIERNPKKSVILCEGIFKALALEEIFGDALTVGAILGHSITEEQIRQLEHVKTVVLWPDPDSVGLKGIVKVAYKLATRFNVVLPSVVPNKQADEMAVSEVESIFESLEAFSVALGCRYEFESLRRKK